MFRQKDPKPVWPWRDPSGTLRRLPPPAARKLAKPGLSFAEGLRQCAPFLRSQLPCSAKPPGQGTC